jgi:hypothetical protein
MNARSVALAAAILLGSAGFIGAQQPTVGDIALCNEEATKQTGGSAFPGPRPGPEIARESTDQKGAREMPEARGGAASRGQTGEKTDPSGSIITESPDPLVIGMDADKADDPAYRTAYRDCMRQQMGRGR